MPSIKHLNHLGSASLLAAVILLTAVLVMPGLGLIIDWKPKTTPWRLVSNPFIGWSLVIALSTGLALIRKGTELMQCVTALVFVGLVFGLAITSALFWDAWLAPMLVYAALPILYAAVNQLKSLAHPSVTGSQGSGSA